MKSELSNKHLTELLEVLKSENGYSYPFYHSFISKKCGRLHFLGIKLSNHECKSKSILLPDWLHLEIINLIENYLKKSSDYEKS